MLRQSYTHQGVYNHDIQYCTVVGVKPFITGRLSPRFRCYNYNKNRFRSELYYDIHVQLLTVNRRSLLTKNCQYLSDQLHCETETLIINRMLEGSMLRDSKQFCNLMAKNRERC